MDKGCMMTRQKRRDHKVTAGLTSLVVLVLFLMCASVAFAIPPTSSDTTTPPDTTPEAANGLYSISGTVTADGGGALEGVKVEVRTEDGGYTDKEAKTDSTGAYTITGLTPGIYKVRTYSYSDYLDEWYDNVPCYSNWSGTAATLIDLRESNAPNIDFSLTLGRTISGTVTADDGGALEGVWVEARTADGWYVGKEAETNSTGAYTITGLAPGIYKVRTYNSSGYLDEWYNNIPCYNNWYGTDATLIDVRESNALNIDFSLALGHTISGTVTADGGGALEGVWVEVWTEDGEYVGKDAETDSTGAYTITGLTPGIYKVRTYNSSGYLDEWYDNVPCYSNWDGTNATLIDLRESNALNIDFSLALGPTISGRVTADDGGALEGVWVEVRTAGGRYVKDAETDSTGAYTITGLTPGTYKVSTSNYSGYLDEWYDNVPCYNNQDGTNATLIDVRESNAPNIDFSLTLGRTISGRVTADDGGALRGVWVEARIADGEYFEDAKTDVTGAYTIVGLVSDTYKVRTYSYSDYLDEWYDNIPSDGNPTGIGATPVDVSEENATGIDFTLGLPGTSGFDLPLAVGWNLVAGGPGSDFLGNTLFGYDKDGYQSLTPDGLVAGKGYWCNASQAQQAHIKATSLPITCTLTTGWNLIGNSSNQKVKANSTLPLFIYDPHAAGYQSVSTLTPGQAAWINSDTDTTITLEAVP
jgi:hypothetical protein